MFEAERRELRDDILRFLPEGSHLWITRGALRSSIFEQLENWDDLDVITDASVETLQSAVERLKTRHRRTMYGGFSWILNCGRKLDIWSLENSSREKCDSLSSALSKFEFDIDAIALDVADGEFEDPLGYLEGIRARRIELQSWHRNRMSDNSKAYTAIKSVYLVIRHCLQPGLNIQNIWRERIDFTPLPYGPRNSLHSELLALNINLTSSSVGRLRDKYPGFSPIVDLLLSGQE